MIWLKVGGNDVGDHLMFVSTLDATSFFLSSYIYGLLIGYTIDYRSVVEKLGADRILKIQTIGVEEVKQSFYGQLVFGKGVSSGLDEQLAKEAYKAGDINSGTNIP